MESAALNVIGICHFAAAVAICGFLVKMFRAILENWPPGPVTYVFAGAILSMVFLCLLSILAVDVSVHYRQLLHPEVLMKRRTVCLSGRHNRYEGLELSRL